MIDHTTFIDSPDFKSWPSEWQFRYIERVSIMVEDGPVTKEAHQEGLNDVERYLKESHNTHEPRRE